MADPIGDARRIPGGPALLSMGFRPFFLAAALFAAIAIPLFVVIGLWSAGDRARTLRVLVGGPRYMIWKAATYLKLLRGHDVNRWDRTDRVAS